VLIYAVAAICLVGTLAACAGSGGSKGQASAANAARPEASVVSTAPSRSPRQRRMAAVVRAWSNRLNAGDNEGLAKLFRLPALVVQGAFVYRLSTREEVAAWHAGLPCSGRIVSITFAGRFATAVFRLGNRPASKCDGPGKLAAARFEIVGGKIASWVQVPVPEQKAETGPVA
jgi:hypothetical protein